MLMIVNLRGAVNRFRVKASVGSATEGGGEFGPLQPKLITRNIEADYPEYPGNWVQPKRGVSGPSVADPTEAFTHNLLMASLRANSISYWPMNDCIF